MLVRPLIVSLCALSCAAAAIVSSWPAGLDIRTEDQNRDGRPDVWRVYDLQGQVATVARDTNFDGRSDVQEYYDGGALVRRESDRDFNDQIDLVQEFDAGTRESVRSVADVDFDGSADLLVLFNAGRSVYSRWRTASRSPDSGRTLTHPSTIQHRSADDRLGPIEDAFESDLAIRGVHVMLGPGHDDYVGTEESRGLPQPRDEIAGLLVSASRIADSELSLPPSAATLTRTPRGPPILLLGACLGNRTRS